MVEQPTGGSFAKPTGGPDAGQMQLLGVPQRSPGTTHVHVGELVRDVALLFVGIGIALDVSDASLKVPDVVADFVTRHLSNAVERVKPSTAPAGGAHERRQGPPAKCPACGFGPFDAAGTCVVCYWNADSPIKSEDAPAPADEDLVFRPVARNRLDVGLTRTIPIGPCTVVGGTGVPLLAGATFVVSATEAGLVFDGPPPFDGVFVLPLDQIDAIEISGPGVEESDLGVIGGGFGFSGAIVGIGVASLLNWLTKVTTVTTHVGVRFRGGELFLVNGAWGPRSLRIALSPLFAALGTSDARAPEADGRRGPRGSAMVLFG